MARLAGAVLALLTVVLPPAEAAESFFGVTPFGALTFGRDAPRTRGDFGLAASFFSDRLVGLELEVGHSPGYYGTSGEVGENSRTTLMANVMVSGPLRGLRPYASGGVGLVRSRVEGPGGLFGVSRTDGGMNLGAGVLGFPRRRLGVRAELRYFRNLAPPEDRGRSFGLEFGSTDFWRVAAGVLLRF